MSRFETLVRRVDERGRGVDLPLMSVSQFRGVIRRSELADGPPRAESLDDYKICRTNDIVFNKMSIRDGAMGVSPEDGLVTYHYEVMRPYPGVDPRFVTYLMKSHWFTGELIKRERGIGAGGASGVRTTEVPFSVLRTIDAQIPDPAGQAALADFLDRETAQIDSMIEAQRTLIHRAVERRIVIVDQAIRRGCRMGMATRESGIPWIGLVPSHWEVRPLGTIGRARIGLTYEPSEIVGDEDGTLVLRAGNIQQGQLSLEDCVYVSTAVPQALRLVAGDLLICTRNGSARLIGKNLLIGPEVVGQTWGAFMSVFRSAMNDHVRWVLNSSILAQQIGLFSTSTINQLTSGMLHSMRIPVPPQDERTEIDAYLTDSTARTDALIRAAEDSIVLMQERRAALISGAVTGLIDPRTGVESTPDKLLEPV